LSIPAQAFLSELIKLVFSGFDSQRPRKKTTSSKWELAVHDDIKGLAKLTDSFHPIHFLILK